MSASGDSQLHIFGKEPTVIDVVEADVVIPIQHNPFSLCEDHRIRYGFPPTLVERSILVTVIQAIGSVCVKTPEI